MNKYYKNMILCSDLDYHCLLCEESFEDIQSVEKHIRWENHRKTFKTQTYIPKYKKDLIQKIREQYYCEICNCVVEYKVLQEHVRSDNHKERKTNSIFDNNNRKIALGSRDHSGRINFPNLTINRLQWHSIDNTKCFLCDTTFKNVNDHISSSKHMTKLIRSQIVEINDHYYRKIEENKLYCFCCATTVQEDTTQSHTCKNDKKHKKSVKKIDEQKKTCESPGVVNILPVVEKENYDINIEDKTVKCKLCNSYVDLNVIAMFKHREEFHADIIDYIDPQDHGKRRSELAAYGRENFIKLNEGGSLGYCSLCDIHLSAHMTVATDHVKGKKHRGHLELKGLIARKKHSLPGCRVQSLQNFLNSLFHVKPLNAFFINHILFVNELSFMFVAKVPVKNPTRLKCFCCDMVFNCNELKKHLETKKHRDAFVAADVLLMDDEFIRIIQPGLFHCGFCNQGFPFWETMHRHIESLQHKCAKKKIEIASFFCMRFVQQRTDKVKQIKVSSDFYKQLLQLEMSIENDQFLSHL